DGAHFVTGRHEYTSDMQRPGLLHGWMIRPPRYGAELAAVDSAEAQKAAGVSVVRDGSFIGVLASSTEDAAKAASLVKCTWTGGGGSSAATLVSGPAQTTQIR